MGKYEVKRQPTKRFAAKLLFQFRVEVDGDSGKRRLCEERIILFNATASQIAVFEARRRGRKAQHKYKNNEGWLVYFEFVGILELLCLDPACEADEVWYDITQRLLPMENRQKLIPSVSKLNAVRNKE